MGFCGSRAVLVMEDQATGVMLFESYYGADTTAGERFLAVGFSGKRTKPDFNYVFKNGDARQAYVDWWLAQIRVAVERRAAKRAEKAAARANGHQLAVGDVLESCWGYEQTNIDYYQVTALIGKCMVEIREIGRMVEETSWIQGNCMPMKNHFKGEPMRKRVGENGKSVKIESWGLWAYKTEAKMVGGAEVFPIRSFSSYA